MKSAEKPFGGRPPLSNTKPCIQARGHSPVQTAGNALPTSRSWKGTRGFTLGKSPFPVRSAASVSGGRPTWSATRPRTVVRIHIHVQIVEDPSPGSLPSTDIRKSNCVQNQFDVCRSSLQASNCIGHDIFCICRYKGKTEPLQVLSLFLWPPSSAGFRSASCSAHMAKMKDNSALP